MPSISQSYAIGIIILAAGGSTRMGTPKQLLEDRQGETMIKKIARLALSAERNKIICVLGAHHETIIKELNCLDLDICINPDWNTGIASSIRLGLSTLITSIPALDAVLFLVCDQPFVSTDLIKKIIRQYSKDRKPIVASHYQGVMGTPALFDNTLFDDLMQLTGDRGAGKVIKEHVDQVALIEFKDGAFDIDTLTEYELYKK